MHQKFKCLITTGSWQQSTVSGRKLECVCHKVKVVNKTDDQSALIRGTRLVLAILKTFRPSSEGLLQFSERLTSQWASWVPPDAVCKDLEVH